MAATWRAEHRGKALGVMQSGLAVGYALASVIAALLAIAVPERHDKSLL